MIRKLPNQKRKLGHRLESLCKFFGLYCLGLGFFFLGQGVQAALDVSVSDIGEVSQLQFSGKNQWVYEVEKNDKYISVELETLSSSAKAKLTSYQSKWIQRIDVEKITEEKDQLKIFVSNSKVESFDYQMEDPSRLILDFFVDTEKKSNSQKLSSKNKEKTKDRKPAGEIVAKVPGAIKKEDLPKPKQQKEPQFLETLDEATLGNFDGGDPDFLRFKMEDYEIKESALIASKRNIYIQFPFLIQKNNIMERILENPPIYEIKAKDSEETKQVKLLKQFFDDKKYAVFVTTLKFFREKFPESKYDQIVRYMEADVYFDLWRRDNQDVDLQKSIALYQNLIKDYPKSPLTERTRLLIAYTFYNKGDNFGALKSFIRMLNDDPNTKYKDDLRVSIGDAYRDINKFQDALDTYNVIYLDEKAGKKRVEAKYKVGDVYAIKKEYKNAISAYQEALKEFPKEAHLFPNALYNIAESQFWLGQYRDSLDSYTAYVRNYPKSSHGGFALTRIGEILQILGADEKKYKGAFLESWFRFRGAEGANIARIRYLSELLPLMKPKAAEAAHRETESYVSHSQLPFMKDFSTIVLSDGYYKRGELDKSLFMLEDFYRNNSTATTLDLFKDRIVKTLARKIEQKLEDKKYIEAIRTFGKYAGTWLRDNDRVDLKYYIGQSFEQSGVPDEAIKIYKATVNKLYAYQNTQEEKERKIFEKYPSIDELNLRLAKSYLDKGDLEETKKYLDKIEAKSNQLSKEENVERVVVQAKLDEKSGNVAQAIAGIQDLMENWSAQPELSQEPLMRLSHLYEKAGKPDLALAQADKIIHLQEDTSLVRPEVLEDARRTKGRLLLEKGELEKAAGIYASILEGETPEKKKNDIRFQLGDIYFQLGNLKQAKETWDKLNDNASGGTWYQMAQDKMKDKAWTEQYDKYLSRMPASAQP